MTLSKCMFISQIQKVINYKNSGESVVVLAATDGDMVIVVGSDTSDADLAIGQLDGNNTDTDDEYEEEDPSPIDCEISVVSRALARREQENLDQVQEQPYADLRDKLGPRQPGPSVSDLRDKIRARADGPANPSDGDAGAREDAVQPQGRPERAAIDNNSTAALAPPSPHVLREEVIVEEDQRSLVSDSENAYFASPKRRAGQPFQHPTAAKRAAVRDFPFKQTAWDAAQVDGSARLLPNRSLTDNDYKLGQTIGLEVCGYNEVSTRVAKRIAIVLTHEPELLRDAQENVSALRTEAIANKLDLQQTKAALAQRDREILSVKEELAMTKRIMMERLGQKDVIIAGLRQWRVSVFDQAGRTGVAEHITRLEDKCEAAVAENSWLGAEMDRIYSANIQREAMFEKMADNIAIKIAPPPGWMVEPMFHAGAIPEQPVMPVEQGDRPASNLEDQSGVAKSVTRAAPSSQKPTSSRPKPARIVTVSRAVAVPAAATAAPKQAATPTRRDSVDSGRGSRMSSRQSNHEELETVQSSEEESYAAQFSPVSDVESESDFSTRSEGSQARAAVAYCSRSRYRGKGKGKGKRSAKRRR